MGDLYDHKKQVKDQGEVEGRQVKDNKGNIRDHDLRAEMIL